MSIHKILSKVGANVRSARQAAELSQEQLAERSGLHRTYITHVECATRNPTILSLSKIAKALKCKVSHLVDGVD